MTRIVPRLDLLARLKHALKGHPFIHAAWLEGADAWGRADEFSDVDLWLDVQAGREEHALGIVRGVVESFGPLTVSDAPRHPDPLLRQRFYGSGGLSPSLFVDVCVQTHGRDVKFTAADPYLVWFDRAEVIQTTKEAEVDVQLELNRLLSRRWRFLLVEKELRRGHPLEALAYYRNEVLTLLVRFLRLRYTPEKLEYGLKHIQHDLPPDALARLFTLHSFSTPDELRQGVLETQAWMQEIAKEIRRET